MSYSIVISKSFWRFLCNLLDKTAIDHMVNEEKKMLFIMFYQLK
jgi:hypothetical protein